MPLTKQTLNQRPLDVSIFCSPFVRGDWGDVCEEDRQANDDALLDGSRLLSAHRTSLGEKLWIITEAVDDSGNRAATAILLPSEY
jgi:hypothetical protein